MTKRQIKKQAKNFIAGRKTTGVMFEVKERTPRTDDIVIITELVPVSKRVVKAIYDAMGGVPCHWDSPFIVNIWFGN